MAGRIASGTVSMVMLACAAMSAVSPAQTLTTLVGFNETNGANPGYMSLVQGLDGSFYGTTSSGGANLYDGTIFKVTPEGTLTTLFSFTYTDGANPYAGLVQTMDGCFYGTSYGGGTGPNYNCPNGCGTIFALAAGDALTTLDNFSFGNGAGPQAGLVHARDGNFYGTTVEGGSIGYGTVFKITPDGSLTTLYSFYAPSDGQYPYGSLVQATDGSFYGTTSDGGSYLAGTIFKITPAGSLTTLHHFDRTNGSIPWAGLIQASDGNLYGTTFAGGAHNYGTVFKIAPAGTLTTLHSFDILDGAYPYAALVQASDGNFYGTTGLGGASHKGTVFKITPAGALTTLYRFNSTDGAIPTGALVQGTDGNFYGTTSHGGANNLGTVFRLSAGLCPFVRTLPISGKVGAPVQILGTDLSNAARVTFNGASAVFTVLSPSLIAATVPSGATTGAVQVVTTSGTLASNVAFHVRP